MNQRSYIEEVLRLFLQQPDTPATAKRSDWAVAADFYRQGIPFDTIAYAIRLATVRRIQRDPDNGPLQPIRSLAYYRTVFNSLTPDELDAGYIGWITYKHAELLAQIKISKPPAPAPSKTRHESRNLALFDRR
jgi:hypothetical protein